MTESDARAVLLLRAFEEAGAPAWGEADATAAGDAARRSGGEAASFESWMVARAHWGAVRLAQRDAAVATLLRAAGWPASLGAILMLLALAVGVASDLVGGSHRINILAPPMFALLVWNLAVYGLLIAHGLSAERPAAAGGPIRSALAGWIARRGALHRIAPDAAAARAWAAFARDWARAARSLYVARSAFVLHVAAAALALGALASLYGRGLVLEYRAGWDSTFLTATDVRAVLVGVLGPASSISGIAVPDVEHLAAVRFAAGPGENAAPWIHLYAITLALAVLVPRAVLGLAAAVRARRLAARFPLDLDDAYFLRLRRGWSGAPVEVRVLPYSYRIAPDQRDGLRSALERHIGARVEPAFADPLPLGAEDDLARWVGALPAETSASSPVSLVALLFALTATPEREHHGAVVRALEKQVGRERMLVLVDASGFRHRFDSADLSWRVDQRRQGWRTLLAEEGIEPVFVDLGVDSAGRTLDAGESAAPGASR